ncbi:MAG: bifunctional 5,10-methylenetetrahydrofolate dehydrogenase/5,10-methenyltetrahydrofolate cyclohydrolase, partial [Lachnospiraceae bacterium]|nr:bifunctional 5,10-methylenetetrahydrofolate dehydrogenase/5,10-methenyltetrahydrofolate cyclohydrolase [Lachnospiraceae bacterium]
MAKILTGKEVAEALNVRKSADVEKLKLRGIIPTLCIFRVGNRADDISYEKGAMKRAEKIGVAVKQIILPEDVREDVFEAELKKANEDPLIHGILLFRPLPPQLDGERARRMLNPAKDIDGSTDISQAGVFTGSQSGFPPCTAEAVMEMLRFYDIDPAGKSAVVIGRSLVIGRPVAMMLMQKNATVTICHTRTQDTAAIA